jgi:hypothetical protein
MVKWYHAHAKDAKDTAGWTRRFEQLLGLPPEDAKTHFSAIWVRPEDLERPAYAWRISDPEGLKSFSTDDAPDSEFKTWFDGNIIGTWFDSTYYPWTRLGYTYDWAPGSGEYGLSEFIIKKGSTVHVEWTKDTAGFLAWLGGQGVLPDSPHL